MHETGQEEATLATLKDAAHFEDEKDFTLTPKDCKTLEEVNDFLKSFTPPPRKRGFNQEREESLERDPADERFFLSSLTGSKARLSYDDVVQSQRGWTKTSGWPKEKIESGWARRLTICYKDISDPTSIVYMVRVLERKTD